MKPAPLMLIVGMHRSGTSLLGSLLPACGIAMPGRLIDGDLHNPEGYFERADITALQEQLLIDLERWWPAPRGMHPLPDNWLELPQAQRALDTLTALLQAEQSQQPKPWAIKDPRSSLLLPLWIRACNQLHIPLELVLAVRDPAEVVVSLVRRDQSATGMDHWWAQRLWWHHNAEVLRHGRQLPLKVVSYSHWFEPERALRQLKALAPQMRDEQLRAVIADTVKPMHRRSHRQAQRACLAAPVKAFHQQLESLALQPSSHAAMLTWLERQPELPARAPLPRRRSRFKHLVNRWRGKAPTNRVASHPWGYLAEIICGSQGPEAEHQLEFWLSNGFRPFELQRFAELPCTTPPATAWHTAEEGVAIQVRANELNSWPVHAWLQHCPVPQEASIKAVPLGSEEASGVALNLADLRPGPACGAELLQLAQLEQVWDPNAERVALLRQFGVNASWLQPQQRANRYLKPHEGTGAAYGQRLGLPTPGALAGLGSTLCLGAGGLELEPPLLGIPGFDQLVIQTPEDGQLLAGWLQACLDAGVELVRFKETESEAQLHAWTALVQSAAEQHAPILLLQEPIGTGELVAELIAHSQPAGTPLSRKTVCCWSEGSQGVANGLSASASTTTAHASTRLSRA